MNASDRLDAIERVISDIPEKARANRRYQDFFNVADVTGLVAALRGVLALHHPVEAPCQDKTCDDYPHSWMECPGCDGFIDRGGECDVYRAVETALTEVSA